MDYKLITFDLYRFQLLPITQNVQVDLLRGVRTVDDLKENKNKIFRYVIHTLEQFTHQGYNVRHKVIIEENDWIVFKIGSQKEVERENHEFITEKIESWPSVTVIINNNPSIQAIAISSNNKAFTSPNVVSNIIEKSLKENLNRQQLTFHIKPLTDKNEFWDLIKKHEGKISSVKFELISPNMSNISKSLKVDLKQINKDTNSQLMNLELNSVPESSLEIKKSNEMIDGIVEYAVEGGGDISLRIKGLKKTVHTQKTTRTIELDEIAAENITVETLNTLVEYLKP